MSIEQKIDKLTEAVMALTAAIKEVGDGKGDNVHGDAVAKPEPAAAPVPQPVATEPVPEAPAPAPVPAPVPAGAAEDGPTPAAPAPSPAAAQQAAPAAPNPPQQAAATPAPVAPATAAPSIDEVNAALVAKAQQLGAEGAAKIRGMLQEKFGVTGISQIPAERLGEVLTAVEELV